jgi:putative toxin-antitoxin system antitoxin component (TIGR02293 family)
MFIVMTEAKVDVATEIQRAGELLGGATVLGHPLREWFDVHEILLQGLPGTALGHLVDSLIVTKSWAAISEALGMSRRTLQRRLNTPEKVLRKEQSNRLWTFAYIVAKATTALGSQQRAENWMASPHASVRGLRPIGLLGSPVGIDIAENLLERTG